MTRHAREHLRCIQAARSKIDDLFRDVLLQSWVHGSSRQYWIVRWPENTCHLSSDLSTPSPVRAMPERERERIMAQANLAMETSPQTLENTLRASDVRLTLAQAQFPGVVHSNETASTSSRHH
jgi:hypothetical protein